jgi:two-component system OmpR family sensor kinase
MRRIEEESTRMSQLVAELLELARLDRTSSLNLTTCDLAAILADAAADATAVQPGRPVQVDAPQRLPAVVDEPRIRQVLANLLANVREHTSPHTPVLLRLVPAGHGVLMEVADAGPGMAPDDAAQAFDRFHRGARGPVTGNAGAMAADSPAGGAGGAGLGLSIVQAIAAAHGGQATLESAPGRGTAVRVWLPVLAAPPAAPDQPTVPAQPLAPQQTPPDQTARDQPPAQAPPAAPPTGERA